jgi:hypothetical protein
MKTIAERSWLSAIDDALLESVQGGATTKTPAKKKPVSTASKRKSAKPAKKIMAGAGRSKPALAKKSNPIPVSSVTYKGAGKYASGQAAVGNYLDKALDARGVTNAGARANWKKGMSTIASRESTFNSPSKQVNRTDSNAVGPKQSDGAPAKASRGAFQTIPSTFAENHQAGTSNDIYDPVANAAAAMNYVQKRYGVASDGSDLARKVQQADPNRSPKGY